jgi:hypothetical protein
MTKDRMDFVQNSQVRLILNGREISEMSREFSRAFLILKGISRSTAYSTSKFPTKLTSVVNSISIRNSPTPFTLGAPFVPGVWHQTGGKYRSCSLYPDINQVMDGVMSCKFNSANLKTQGPILLTHQVIIDTLGFSLKLRQTPRHGLRGEKLLLV